MRMIAGRKSEARNLLVKQFSMGEILGF